MHFDPQSLFLVVVDLAVAAWMAFEIVKVVRRGDETTLPRAMRDLRLESDEPPAAKPALHWLTARPQHPR